MIHERDIEAHLVSSCKGFEVRKVQWVGRWGAPDRVIFAPGGVVVWVELKAPGKKPRPNQLREHERMRAMGQRVEVIDSIDGVDRLVMELRM